MMSLKTGYRFIIHAFSRSPARSVGITVLAFLTLVAIAAPYITHYNPDATGIPYLQPSTTHLLGTDDMGQDIFSELIYSSRASLLIGYLAGAVSIIIGVSVGVMAGYYRGWFEEFLMGVTDIFLLVPGLPLIIILAAYLGPSIWNIVAVVGLFWWCSTARVIHSRVLQIREMQFIESTKALGYSDLYIVMKHVLINTSEVIYAKFALAVGSAMLSEASLSFLGLGDPLNVSWGEMIHFAFSRGGFTNNMWWWYLPPGIMICISVICFILVGTGGKKRLKIGELI